MKALEFTKKAYVIGSEGIIEEMILKSIKHTEIGVSILFCVIILIYAYKGPQVYIYSNCAKSEYEEK